MARIRTTPESRPGISLDTIEQFGVVLAYNEDGTVNTDLVRFVYTVNNREAGGNVVKSLQRTLMFPDWPAAIKTDLKSIYVKVLADAQNQSLIGAGTDTDDLP